MRYELNFGLGAVAANCIQARYAVDRRTFNAPSPARAQNTLCCLHALSKSALQGTMYKAFLHWRPALALVPSVHQRATVAQQGVPLANGAMEFDRMRSASGIDRCAHDMRRRRARAHACNTRTVTNAGVCERRCKHEGDKATSASPGPPKQAG